MPAERAPLRYSRGPTVGALTLGLAQGEVSPSAGPAAAPHRREMHRAEMRGALLGRPASTPTAPLRLRCPVWASSTSRTSDAADDASTMADVSRLTPRPSPAHQPRTASMAPPRALADGRDGTERPDNEAHLVDRADRAADQLPPDTRSMTGLARGAPPAGAPPRRPPPASALGQLTSLSRVPDVARRPRGTRRHRTCLKTVARLP